MLDPANPITFDTVPEPMTLSLFGAGLAGIDMSATHRSAVNGPLDHKAPAYDFLLRMIIIDI